MQTGETVDINSSGLLLNSGDGMPPGERVEFVVTLLSRPALVRVRCSGTVLRSDPAGDAGQSFNIALTIDRYHLYRLKFDTVAMIP